MVHKYVFTIFLLNETKSLAVVKPLNRSFCHNACPPFLIVSYCLSGTAVEDATKPHRYGEKSILERILKQKS
jgi:hypothetical protein